MWFSNSAEVSKVMAMRYRLLCGFLLLLLPAFTAFGQGGFTTVSGVIVDPSGIPWAGGTISAQLITQGGTAPTLNGQPFTSTTTSGILGPTGNFTMRLGDSGLIVPSTTTWQFTISIAPGVLPPFGKGPQSFTVTTAINCGTNTPAVCASNAMTITAALTPVPALAFSSGGGTPAAPANSLQFNNAGAFGGVGPSATVGNVFTGQTTGPGVFNTTLNYQAPTLTVSAAGSGNGQVALSGNTSGTATFTAPAVAGTSTNAVISSNVIGVPDGGAGNPAIQRSAASNTGLFFSGNNSAFSGSGTIAAIFVGSPGLSGTNTIGMVANGTSGSLAGTGACATTSTVVSGGWAGNLTCTGTTGASTLVITPGFTVAHGFSCAASDLTTAANILRQSAESTTTCTIAGTVNANDVLTFLAVGY
jgi:hypothetical protein